MAKGSTELAAPAANGQTGDIWLALQPDSELNAALAANIASGESFSASDLVRIKTPAGGSRTWQWTDAGNNEREARVIRGLLVCYLVRGTLWGRDDVSKGV